MVYFPIYEYWWLYLTFVVFIVVVLFLDLGIFHKKAHVVSVREATIWTSIWISLAVLFSLAFYFYAVQVLSVDEPQIVAKRLVLEFLTGFLIEKALAIDNIFIFAVVFSYFGIPRLYQHRILFWGIFGALLFRGIFIAIGAALMKYQFVVIFFGLLLFVTGVRLFFIAEKKADLSKNFLLKQINNILNVTPEINGDRFLVKKNGRFFLTPLFVALIFIELSDIIFAVDSVPAIFAITNEPLIVFTSNVFAILGLRSMYFMLSGAIDKFRYIKYGLAGVMMFVGIKMTLLNNYFGGHFPIWLSFLIIIVILAISIMASWLLDKKPTMSTKVLR